MVSRDNLNERLAAARNEDAMRQQAIDLSIAASHMALDRLVTAIQDSVAFLAAHEVPTLPLVAESYPSTLWAGFRKAEDQVGTGWPVGGAYGIAVAADGKLWQTERVVTDGRETRQWAAFDFGSIRETHAAAVRDDANARHDPGVPGRDVGACPRLPGRPRRCHPASP